jgi:hypothetical protein
VLALATNISSELEVSQSAWSQRLAAARLQQRVFTSSDEAASCGFFHVEVSVSQVRVRQVDVRMRTTSLVVAKGEGSGTTPSSSSGLKAGMRSLVFGRRNEYTAAEPEKTRSFLEVGIREGSDFERRLYRVELPRSESPKGMATTVIPTNQSTMSGYLLILKDASIVVSLSLRADKGSFSQCISVVEALGCGEAWVPLSPEGSVIFGVEVLLRVTVSAPSRPREEALNRLPPPPLETYLFGSYRWMALLGMSVVNPLACDEDDPDQLRDACDRLLSVEAICDIRDRLQALQTHLCSLCTTLSCAIDDVSNACFRSSRLKKEPALQALPVNLHAQLLLLSGDARFSAAQHSLSSGCVSPHGLGHSREGLDRLEAQLQTDRTLLQSLRDGRGNRALLADRLAQYEFSLLEIAQRRFFAISQALAIAVSGLLLKLQMAAAGFVSAAACDNYVRLGFPLLFEGLLSVTNLIGKEKGMVEDCTVAINALRDFSVAIEEHCEGASEASVVMTGRVLTLRLPASLLERLPPSLTNAVIRLVPVYFNQGIDLVQSIASAKTEAEKKLSSALQRVQTLIADQPLIASDFAANSTVSANQAQYNRNFRCSRSEISISLTSLTQPICCRALQRLNEYYLSALPYANTPDYAEKVTDASGILVALHPGLISLSQAVSGAKISEKVTTVSFKS